MRLVLGQVLVMAGLTFAAACAGPGAQDPAGRPSIVASAPGTACDEVKAARETALAAFAPVAATLAKPNPAEADIAQAAHDLRAAFNALHFTVAAAAERAADGPLKTALQAYQVAAEQAIVIVEGADGDPAELASAIGLAELRDAEKAVLAACG